jgi:hypothetical protein
MISATVPDPSRMMRPMATAAGRVIKDKVTVSLSRRFRSARFLLACVIRRVVGCCEWAGGAADLRFHRPVVLLCQLWV